MRWLLLCSILACTSTAPESEDVTTGDENAGHEHATDDEHGEPMNDERGTDERATEGPTDERANDVPTDDADEPPASCPDTFAEAESPDTFDCSSHQPLCRYAEGDCTCVTPRRCGGARLSLNPQPLPPRWTCTPRVRDDGCTSAQPDLGSPCATEGQSCTYAPCGGVVLECQRGAWARTRTVAPPP